MIPNFFFINLLKEQKAPMKLVSLEKQPSLVSKYSTLSDFDLRNNVPPGPRNFVKVPRLQGVDTFTNTAALQKHLNLLILTSHGKYVLRQSLSK